MEIDRIELVHRKLNLLAHYLGFHFIEAEELFMVKEGTRLGEGPEDWRKRVVSQVGIPRK